MAPQAQPQPANPNLAQPPAAPKVNLNAEQISAAALASGYATPKGKLASVFTGPALGNNYNVDSPEFKQVRDVLTSEKRLVDSLLRKMSAERDLFDSESLKIVTDYQDSLTKRLNDLNSGP